VGIFINGNKVIEPIAMNQPALDLNQTFFEWLQKFVIPENKVDENQRIYYSDTGEVVYGKDHPKFYNREPGPFSLVFSTISALNLNTSSAIEENLPTVLSISSDVSVEDNLRITAAFVALFQSVCTMSEPSYLGAIYLLLVALFIREINPQELISLLGKLNNKK
jgi:hypothetical protein